MSLRTSLPDGRLVALVDHGPGAHDDRANAAAGVLTLLAARHFVTRVW